MSVTKLNANSYCMKSIAPPKMDSQKGETPEQVRALQGFCDPQTIY